jgi:mRNA-degrading endonuclease RelE of RelBE toxin-antitoxin system
LFTVFYDEGAEDDLRRLRAHEVSRIMDEVDGQLGMAPATAGRRKKRLEGIDPPWDAVRPVWQLRVGDFRVFYDVDAARRQVVVRAIRRKGSKTTEEIL